MTRTLSDIHKKHLSESLRGRTAHNKGKRLSNEQKNKMSEISKRLGLKPPSRIGIKLTEKQRIELSKKRKMGGEKHWNWKGGINPKNDSARKSLEYKLWRKSVFERDNYTCQFCGVKGGQLNVDHIKPFALYQELRFEISNGRTLCVSCHKKTDTYGNQSIYKTQCVAVA